MARRAAVIDSERVRDPELILLSAGDFYGKSGILEMYRSRFISEMMIRMGYTAVALGERELSYDLRAIRADAEAGLPVICANLYENGERVFPAYVVEKIGGCTVGVFALLGEGEREIGGLELRDPRESGEEILEELGARKCDLTILLAHMRAEKLKDLLPALEGIDVVIRGHTPVLQDATDDCADTTGGSYEDLGAPVLFAGDRGRAIGKLTIASTGGSQPVITMRGALHLDKTVAEDLEVAKRLKEFIVEEGVRRRDLALSELLARDKVTGQIKERYIGIEMCRRCHADIMPRFVLSRHFRAFETLELSEDTENAKCIACHTTGYGRFSGYDQKSYEKGGINLRGVQCEACHGQGTLHSRDGAYKRKARKSCRRCHTSHWSPDFDFETYWAKAGHCTGRDSTAGDH